MKAKTIALEALIAGLAGPPCTTEQRRAGPGGRVLSRVSNPEEEF
ncbi:MAG: hypothetical protein ABSF73_04850 [Terriglobia bacterium]|jgi:hypothetical protein